MSTRDGPYDEPPANRQKLQTKIQRSPNFWFETGNFVLIASKKVAFRVHADILGRKSKVFRDMLTLDETSHPRLEDSVLMMDGCPIVHITDSPTDFFTFLSRIYDAFQHQRLRAPSPRWKAVKAMLLLGEKYGVPALREEGLDRLRAWYAEDIDAWDGRRRGRQKGFFVRKTDHLSVASITHALDEPALHAAVLYHCAALSPALLVAGAPAAGCPPLCAEDLVRMLTFSRNVPQAWHSFEIDEYEVFGWCEDEDCDQIDAEDVRSDFDDIIREKLDSGSSGFLDYAVWDTLHIEDSFLCDDCVSGYDEYLRSLRQRCRSKLPEYFGYVQPFVKPVL